VVVGIEVPILVAVPGIIDPVPGGIAEGDRILHEGEVFRQGGVNFNFFF